MASLARFGVSLARHNGRLLRQPGPVLRVASISTSRKNKDTAASLVEQPPAPTATPEQPEKNWVSWGYSNECQTEDNTLMHLTFFFGITLCMVTTGFVWAYIPDYKMADWAQREAFLELKRRETMGLPLVDPDLINPDNIELPSDEELGSTEIII